MQIQKHISKPIQHVYLHHWFIGFIFMFLIGKDSFGQGIINIGAQITQTQGTWIVTSSGTGGSYESNNSGTLNLNGEGIKLGGNLNSLGPINCNPCKLEINGSTPQNIFTGGNAFEDVIINNPQGITLLDDLTIINELELISGVISTGTNMVIMTSSSSTDLIGGNNSSFIHGQLRRYFSPYNQDTYIFPVGTGTINSDYFQADFINNNLDVLGSDYLTVSVNPINESYGDDELINTFYQGTPIINVYEDAEWTITPQSPTITGGTYGINLWINNITSNPLQDNHFTIVKRDEQSTTYADWDAFTNCPIPAPNDPGRTVLDGFAQKTGFTSFSKFAVGQGINPLPIELLSFSANPLNDKVLLTWETASESNNEWFTIEKSKDGWDFEEVIKIPGAGTSNHILSYEAIDDNPIPGTSYYRLKQTDFDGQFEYSNMVTVVFEKAMAISLWPNPVNSYLNISMNPGFGQVDYDLGNEETTLIIYNSQGEVLQKNQISNLSDNYKVNVTSLESGMYFLIIQSIAGTTKKSFIKQ